MLTLVADSVTGIVDGDKLAAGVGGEAGVGDDVVVVGEAGFLFFLNRHQAP